MAIAYCWQGGEIGIGHRTPAGALPIIGGPKRRLEKILHRTARLAYDNKTWLVPGIPEADNSDAKLDALFKYKKRAEELMDVVR